MSTPTITTMHNEITQAIALLQFVDRNLDDLHVLAYNRHQAARNNDVVKGGAKDYALDTHGDPEAREHLISIKSELYNLINGQWVRGAELPGLRKILEEAQSFLTKGKGGSRSDTSHDATTDEVIESIDAQRRRKQRGEYAPSKIADQPTVISQTEWRNETEALRSAVRKAVQAFVDEHQACQAPELDHRGQRPKLKRRIQTKLLTPREREAWNRATQSVSAAGEPKAS